jgi:hypothetical protein
MNALLDGKTPWLKARAVSGNGRTGHLTPFPVGWHIQAYRTHAGSKLHLNHTVLQSAYSNPLDGTCLPNSQALWVEAKLGSDRSRSLS